MAYLGRYDAPTSPSIPEITNICSRYRPGGDPPGPPDARGGNCRRTGHSPEPPARDSLGRIDRLAVPARLTVGSLTHLLKGSYAGGGEGARSRYGPYQ